MDGLIRDRLLFAPAEETISTSTNLQHNDLNQRNQDDSVLDVLIRGAFVLPEIHNEPNELASGHQLSINVDDEFAIRKQHSSIRKCESIKNVEFFDYERDLTLPQVEYKSQHNYMESKKGPVHNVPCEGTIPTPINLHQSQLIDYNKEDLVLDDVFGDTSLFPEIFTDQTIKHYLNFQV